MKISILSTKMLDVRSSSLSVS